MLKRLFVRLGILPFLLVIAVVVFTLMSDNFLTGRNLMNVLRQSVYLMIVSLGQMLALLTGGFDLSVGTILAISSVVGAMNSPQKCNYGLYGEQLTGTAFTAPSHQNERTWCYRIRPSVKHSHRYEKVDLPYWKSAPNIDPDVISLGQYRWNPVPHSGEALTFVSGMRQPTNTSRWLRATNWKAFATMLWAPGPLRPLRRMRA